MSRCKCCSHGAIDPGFLVWGDPDQHLGDNIVNALLDEACDTINELGANLSEACFVFSACLCFTGILNKCLSSPCKNNATCEDLTDDYICHCPMIPVAFTGKNCEELFNVCASYPCQHNATCKSILGTADFSCDCPPDRTGTSCESYINKCASTPCLNGAICLHNATGYSCICPLGYTGTDCGTSVNECAPNPCENGAVCKDKLNGFSCFCVPGYQGKLCEIEVNECASEPCRNESTCVNGIDKYTCICPLGLTGTHCELEINECSSQPCLNGATCQDHFASYTCTCSAGFTGNNCEVNFDECASHPCQNGGKCINEANGYSCDCVNTGYTGLHCDFYVPGCLSQPCLNSATCQDTDGNYTCHCWPGFVGARCEIDIPECFSNPCLHGAECVELSWRSLYGNTTELPVVFSYERASGYICKCQHGFTGSHCEMDVNECELSPCQNGGTCQNTLEGYICHCPTGSEQEIFYGGQNCTDILTGCKNHECQNKATCIPYVIDSQHRYHCRCANGYIGLKCQLSTTFSFAVSGHLHFKTSLTGRNQNSTNKLPYHVFLRCRTVLSNALIFHRGTRKTFMKLEILNGHLYASLQISNELVAGLEIFKNVSDGEWHAVEVTFSRNFSVKLLDNSCLEECMILKFIGMESEEFATAFENIFFGGMEDSYGGFSAATQPQAWPHFIGCLQDLTVESKVIDMGALTVDSALNVKPGCSKSSWCQSNPCQGKGQCIDLLTNYTCECSRPYIGWNCSEELIPGGFGYEDSKSYALFVIDDDPGEEVNISMFVRSHKPDGALLILRNSSVLYLQMELEAGHVVVRSHLSKPLTSDHYIMDSEFYLITVELKQNTMKLVQMGQVVGHVQIPPIRIRTGDVVYIGGLPDQPQHAQDTRHFEGCIQDVKINNKRLEFYPISIPKETYSNRILVNITSGCNGNNACKVHPCLNGGICSSIEDDFVCNCPSNTLGKTCNQVQWCQLSPCPQGSKCHLIRGGSDCLISATFKGEERLTFRGNGNIKRQLTNVTFSLRTRESNAVVLHAVKEQDFITVGTQQGHLVFMIQSGNSWGNLSICSSNPISDGLWHDVTFRMSNPLLQYSSWQLEVDRKEIVTSATVSGNLNFLRAGTDIYLGGGDEHKGGNFKGCLNTVKLAGISLPYIAIDNMDIIQPQQEQFIQTSFKIILLGCPTESTCSSNPCKNNGKCEDMVSYYRCSCPAGWNCEENIDNCQSSPCVHGNCTDEVSAYKCVCLPGFTGTNCEVSLDNCQKHKCANGATCIDTVSNYSCNCPSNFTGRFCQYHRLSITFCHDENHNWTCYNGGNCTEEKDARCTCPLGFTGSLCEIDMDECESNPCLNGGFCQDLPNKFQCICDMSFAGDRCEFDLNQEAWTSELLLYTGLVTVVLLLIFFLVLAATIMTLNKRATHGAYSPSRQEKEGSRVEMWNMVQPPQVERLI
ncbi:protein crumbs homolog 1 [Hypanus sabinus]|uniref:protein crumbs homolog 1 n=1 Tax=Hypanus sabinus TaxID=79690 RepID=UPI0028C4BA51|nr:protein crumbs homolog 1 [Hypanus sabinus]